MARKRITVIDESPSGRNRRFKLPSGQERSRAELVKEIEKGKHPGYHVAKIHGMKTPRSNPDGSEENNLD